MKNTQGAGRESKTYKEDIRKVGLQKDSGESNISRWGQSSLKVHKFHLRDF